MLESCERLAREVRAETGRRALAHACHVGRWEDLDRLAEAAYAAFGHHARLEPGGVQHHARGALCAPPGRGGLRDRRRRALPRHERFSLAIGGRTPAEKLADVLEAA
jgi:hypothetical protein